MFFTTAAVMSLTSSRFEFDRAAFQQIDNNFRHGSLGVFCPLQSAQIQRDGRDRACLNCMFRLSEFGGVGQGPPDDKAFRPFQSAFLSPPLSATTAARADYAVATFKDGSCRA